MKYILILMALVLSGCGCPVDVGDIVKSLHGGRVGIVIGIDNEGRLTENCKISVSYYKGYLSEDFEYAFKYEVVK